MRGDLEAREARPPVLRRAAAGLVLVGVGALGIWLAIGVIKTIRWTAVVIVAVVAVAWALKTLVW